MKINITIVQKEGPKYPSLKDEVFLKADSLEELQNIFSCIAPPNSSATIELNAIITLPCKHPEGGDDA